MLGQDTHRTLRKKAIGPTHRPLSRPSLLNRRTLWALLFVAALLGTLYQTGLFRRDLVNAGGWTLVTRFFRASLRPQLSPEFLRLALDATLTTLAFAISGTFLSVIFGFVGGILASEVWWESFIPRRLRPRWFGAYRAPWLIIRSVLAVLRGIHEIVWGLFFVNVIGLDPLTAILAIAIPFGAIIAKVFSEILDETPREPLIALQNSGVPPTKPSSTPCSPRPSPTWSPMAFTASNAPSGLQRCWVSSAPAVWVIRSFSACKRSSTSRSGPCSWPSSF